MRKRYKVISKVRFYLFLVTILVICSIFIMSVFSKGKVHSSAYDTKYYEVEVVEGDTLWNIALDYLPEKTDIRKLIYDIKKLNEIPSGYIYPGDVIKVPIH